MVPRSKFFRERGAAGRSEAAYQYFEQGSGYENEIHLEHVKPREVLVKQLLQAKNIEEVAKILGTVATCVVTREEHKSLDHRDQSAEDRPKRGGKDIENSNS
jgi:hypothetical protein